MVTVMSFSCAACEQAHSGNEHLMMSPSTPNPITPTDELLPVQPGSKRANSELNHAHDEPKHVPPLSHPLNDELRPVQAGSKWAESELDHAHVVPKHALSSHTYSLMSCDLCSQGASGQSQN